MTESAITNLTESSTETKTPTVIDSSGVFFDSASFGYGVLAGLALILFFVGIKKGISKMSQKPPVAYSRIPQ